MKYGYLGNATWKDNKQLYNVWKSILRRCRCENHVRYNAYKNVEICKEWECFENFINDSKNIDGWNEIEFEKHNLQLDKDYKQKGKANKIYSKNTCMWTNKHYNNIFQPSKCKKFKMINEKNEEKIYISQHECARENNMQVSLINACLKNRRNTHKNCKFEYCQ